MAYLKSIPDVLIRYVVHNDHKFDYIEGIAHRKHITIDRTRDIGKESNNLGEANVLAIQNYSVLEYHNLKILNLGLVVEHSVLNYVWSRDHHKFHHKFPVECHRLTTNGMWKSPIYNNLTSPFFITTILP